MSLKYAFDRYCALECRTGKLISKSYKRYVPHWCYVPPMRFSISISLSLLRLTLDELDKSIVGIRHKWV